MHDLDATHTHDTDESRDAVARFIWSQECVALTTVGIDIGSSTSHLTFSRLLMQRRSQALSSRFVVTARETLWRSPIMLTPFLADGTIDADALSAFVRDSYDAAGLAQSDVDSGAVILTGEAIKRKNARAVDELFAEEAGKFVCATAGHNLECILAAHGAGAVKRSRESNTRVLHVDVGGGTTKLALIENGVILAVSALAAGGRLVATDENGAWTRIEDKAREVADDLALAIDGQALRDIRIRKRMASRLAEAIVDRIVGAPFGALGAKLQLTAPLPGFDLPDDISFSGGVSEYLYGREDREFGDIAKLLAESLRSELADRVPVPIAVPAEGIRATVIGASQFAVQVSGKTIYLSDPSILPLRNVPVLSVDGSDDAGALAGRIRAGMARLGLEPQECIAIAMKWSGSPEHSALARTAHGVMAGLNAGGVREAPLILVFDGDVAKNLGHILRDELGLVAPLVSLDGLELQELDFVDIGARIDPPGVVPVVIKSLLFG